MRNVLGVEVDNSLEVTKLVKKRFILGSGNSLVVAVMNSRHDNLFCFTDFIELGASSNQARMFTLKKEGNSAS